jgi:ABC-type transport system involved in cytochrome c biogenesis permease subunit
MSAVTLFGLLTFIVCAILLLGTPIPSKLTIGRFIRIYGLVSLLAWAAACAMLYPILTYNNNNVNQPSRPAELNQSSAAQNS